MDFGSYPDIAMDSIINEAIFDFVYNKCVISEVQGIQRLAIYYIYEYSLFYALHGLRKRSTQNTESK